MSFQQRSTCLVVSIKDSSHTIIAVQGLAKSGLPSARRALLRLPNNPEAALAVRTQSFRARLKTALSAFRVDTIWHHGEVEALTLFDRYLELSGMAPIDNPLCDSSALIGEHERLEVDFESLCIRQGVEISRINGARTDPDLRLDIYHELYSRVLRHIQPEQDTPDVESKEDWASGLSSEQLRALHHDLESRIQAGPPDASIDREALAFLLAAKSRGADLTKAEIPEAELLIDA